MQQPKGKNFRHAGVIEDFESTPHKAVTFVVERGKERQEWNEQKLPKTLPGYSGGRLPGRSTERKGKEEGEEGEGSEQRQVRNEIIEEVVRSSQMMALEANPIQRLVCSQTANEEEEEGWQEGDQMAEQWEEEQHLEETVERRRIEGSSLKLDATQKVPKLLVIERMSLGEKVNNPKEKKKVPGWSIEE